MFGMTSGDTSLTILLIIYGIYCAWAKYCEHRWPKRRTPQESSSER